MQYIKAYPAIANGLLTWLRAYYDMWWLSSSWETDLHNAYDLSKTGTVGSQTGKSWNARWAFATRSDYLSTSSWPTFSATQATSISCRIYLPSSPSSYETFVSVGGEDLNDWKMEIRVDNAGHFQLNMEKNQVAWNQATRWSTFSTSTWYHMVATYDWANNGKLYVDAWTAVTGVFWSSGTASDTKIAIWWWLYDGWGWFVANSAVHAYIDEIGIRSRELSSSDVSALYSSWAWLFYWSFN